MSPQLHYESKRIRQLIIIRSLTHTHQHRIRNELRTNRVLHGLHWVKTGEYTNPLFERVKDNDYPNIKSTKNL